MHWFIAVLVSVFVITPLAAEQPPIPEKRVVITRDTDFFGSDLQALFDTNYDACIQACLNEAQCAAFTFNSRSNACFPKSEISDRQPYEGAFSGEVYRADSRTLALGNDRVADLTFLRSGDLAAARGQAADIGRAHAAGPWSIEDMIDTARARLSDGDTLNAMRWTGGAVSKSDRSDLWTEYARLNLELGKEKGSNRRKYRERSFWGAINGYLRAADKPAQVSSLLEMARALEDLNRGQTMLRVLRLAERIQPRDDVVAMLEDAIGKYGFRVTEHRVESDLAEPRICAEFNEDLVQTSADYATYVRLPDQRLSVEADERQICIGGVEHGERYKVVFREGLPAASGEKLIRDVELTVYVRDRSPSVRFPGRAYVLPRSAQAGLPIETTNLDKVALQLHRVSDRNLLRAIQDSYFGKPLSYWQIESFSADVAESVWVGEAEVQNTLNQEMTTRLPIGDVIAEQAPGVYALTADLPGADKYDETSVTQWFVLSDLGVTTFSGTDGLHVFVRGLSDAGARPGAKVTLLSRANRILGSTVADANGHAVFQAGLTRGTGSSSPAMVTLENGDDFSFLSLTDPAFDLSDRGIEGHPAAPPVDMFLATDRGAYRAGETIYATALARDGVAQAISGLPMTAILTRPDGVEYARHTSLDDLGGGHVFSMPVGTTVPRGTWQLQIKSDPEGPVLVTRKILVEDFLPERLDFTVQMPEEPLQPGIPTSLTVEARYLFGAPGAGLKVQGELRLRARNNLPGLPGYVFGRHDEPFRSPTEYFGDSETDTDGRAILDLFPPETEQTGRPLTAELLLQVSEGSGRPVERRVSHPVSPSGPIIGIKPLFGDGVVAENTQAAFDLVGLSPDLTPSPMNVRWTVNRLRTTYQWYQLYGDWNWEPTTHREQIATGEVSLGNDALEVSAPVEWGQYEIIVERLDGDYVASSTDFHAGWYAPADASATPDTLELSLDKPGYRSGETAMLRIVPRFAGTALISVLSNRLITMKAVEVSEGENLIPLDVSDEWGAGAYVTASVVRPANAPARMNPARAIGLSYAKIDPGTRQLDVTLDAPEKIAPNGKLDIGISVQGVQPGETAYITLAAVDLGILNLTGFQSPDPSDHYFGQRRLGVEIRDIYGRLIDGLNGEMGALRSGGDAGSRSRFQSPPPTEELVAFFEGPIQIGEDGKASVSLDLPDFNGTVRLMAVAWSPRAVGQAERDVLVRNPVVVTASLPRFLAPGDTSRLLLEIVHAEGPIGRAGLDLTAEGVELGTQKIPSGVDLGAQQTVRLAIPVTAQNVGDHLLRVAITTPGGQQLVKSLTLPVRANDPAVGTTRRLSLSPGDTFTLDGNLFADLRAGTATATVSSGPLARFDAPGLLQSLDRYPYGCTEQITSRALPLLYFDNVAQALDLGSGHRVQDRIDQAIAQVLTRQAGNGAFGLWYPDSGDFWLDAYVTDFLSRARAKGYDVPQTAFRSALDNLRNRINYAADFNEGGTDIAYALMVLAREGAANMGDLRYFADEKAEDFKTALAQAQLGAALAFYGDQTRADRLFGLAWNKMNGPMSDESDALWRVDYGTNLRDAAGVLTLAAEAGSDAVDRDRLAGRITGETHSLSTQEAVWSLLAANALIDAPGSSSLTVNGAPVEGPIIKTIGEALSNAPMRITNAGNTATDLTITSVGVPEYRVEKGGYGYTISRRYYTMDGQVADLSSVPTGERMVVVLEVSPADKVGARLMVNDPLPAGFEIDNPNLLESGDVRELAWLEPAIASHSEFRSDRFLAAVDWRSAKPFQLAYVVRAVSPGQYHHPAASVEDMYRPQYRANSDAGRLVVAE